MMTVHRNSKIHLMYSDSEEEIKESVGKRIITLRNEEPPRTYKDCTETIQREFNIIVTRNNIYNAIRRSRENGGNANKNRIIRRKKTTKIVTPLRNFLEADDSTKSIVIQKIISIFAKSKTRERYEEDKKHFLESTGLTNRDLIKTILQDFNIKIEIKEVHDIIRANIKDVKSKINEYKRISETSGQRKKKKRKKNTRPRPRYTIEMTISTGVVKISYELCNIVFSGTVNAMIEIDEFMRANPDAEYHPHNFPGIVIKLDEPPSSILLFKTGRFVSVGLRELADISKIKHILHDRIEKSGVSIDEEAIEAEVKNIVLTTALPYDGDKLVDLNMLGLMLNSCMYEPEVFPGLIYKLRENPDGTGEQKAVFLIFSSKKVVCVGIRNMNSIEEIITQFIKSIDKMGDSIYIDKFSQDDIPDDLRFLDLS